MPRVPRANRGGIAHHVLNRATGGVPLFVTRTPANCHKTVPDPLTAREYRTRLIADAVTGKVDVRHLAPPPGSEYLEEMVEELEPLDDTAGELDEEALTGEVAE